MVCLVGLVDPFLCTVWWLGFSMCYVWCVLSGVLVGMCDSCGMCLVFCMCCVFSVI